MADRPRAFNTEIELDYAYVRDTQYQGSDGTTVRITFVRLVHPGEKSPADTYTTDAHVDEDDAGNIIGITLTQLRSAQTGPDDVPDLTAVEGHPT